MVDIERVLFALGALQYLADSGANRHVTSIASVSGGSLTNAYIAQRMDYQSITGDAFQARTAPFANQLAVRGTAFAPFESKCYMALLGLAGVAALLGPWFLPTLGFFRALICVAAILLWSFLFARRGDVCAHAFAKTLFTSSDLSPLLKDINRTVDHVFCATELQSAQHMFFSADFVYSYLIGKGTPADLPLHIAVQASACFPGGFPPRWLPTRRHDFQFPSDMSPTSDERPSKRPRLLPLVDGGVYDNMADQWAQGFEERKTSWPTIAAELRQPEEMIVVNASGRAPWIPFQLSSIPAFGEVRSLLRDENVTYTQTTALREKSMIRAFELATATGKGMKGALINIRQSPFRVPLGVMNDPQWSSEAQQRATLVLKALGDTQGEWARIAKSNAAIGTVLSKLGTDASAQLIHHGYVLAMANLHTILGYPLLPIPDPTRFKGMVS